MFHIINVGCSRAATHVFHIINVGWTRALNTVHKPPVKILTLQSQISSRGNKLSIYKLHYKQYPYLLLSKFLCGLLSFVFSFSERYNKKLLQILIFSKIVNFLQVADNFFPL